MKLRPRRPVVITGVGMVTPVGHDTEQTWTAVSSAASGVDHISLFDASGFPTRIGAEVRHYETPDRAAPGKYRKYLDRKLSFAAGAAREALERAGLATGDAPGLNAGAVDPVRFGVAVGTEAGRPRLSEVAERFLESRKAADPRAALAEVDPVAVVQVNPNLCAWVLGAVYGAQGPSVTVSTACTSSAQAIGDAFEKVRDGRADVMLAGGCDALVEAFMVTGFSLLGALSKRNDDPPAASRPFDKRRDGFVLAEGAGFFVLESEAHARARGARILAGLAGYGSTANAYRMTDSPPDGSGAVQAMEAALADAERSAGDVDYINAHGTSTQMNDVSETNAVKRLLGERAYDVPMSSSKSMLGHLVAACGVVEAGICVQALQHQVAPPTINQEVPDPVCDLDYVPNEARPTVLNTIVTNSFGFGGNNATLVLTRSNGDV